MEIISETTMFGGHQLTVEHESQATRTPMRVAVFPLSDEAMSHSGLFIRSHMHRG